MTRRGAHALRATACLALALVPGAVLRAGEASLARKGRAQLPLVVAREAIPAELTAAVELGSYLRKITGSRGFHAVRERARGHRGPAIFVGPTARAMELGLEPRVLGPEEWRILVRDGSVFLVGGRPRGTLYAVYHFLEHDLGVRWWTPEEETLPSRPSLAIGDGEARGRPAFAYRDITGFEAPATFWAHSRINGHFTFMPWALGGREAYGPPDQVHDFFRYVPPTEYFDTHPEYFSEIDGARTTERSQLCLTNSGLVELVAVKLRSNIESARRAARERREPAPRLFDFSQNDWGGWCGCAACGALLEREGSPSGALVQFLNRLGGSIAQDYPDVLLDTLAYGKSIEPPRYTSLRDNVVVRLAALYDRDFSKPASDPVHGEYRRAIEGWRNRTRHLRIWDYIVTFGAGANLPLPNLPVFAEDLRYHLEHDVEGVFVQQDDAVLADLRDLKLWVLVKLLEEPRRDLALLVEEFTDGYYGAAGAPLRDYLALLERAARDKPSFIGFPVEPDDWRYLDGSILLRAHELFDRAEGTVAGDPPLLRRVRRARLSLDRATVLRWSEVFGKRLAAAAGAGRTLDLHTVAERCRDTAWDTIELRLAPYERERARRRIDRELRRVIERLLEAAEEPA